MRRPKTIAPTSSCKDLIPPATPAELEALHENPRPKTRGDCVEVPRPCPYVSCKHHLYLEVTQSGGIRITFPDHGPEHMSDSCVLDVADRDGQTLHEVGQILNLTRERIRQLEVRALSKLHPDAVATLK